jgi:hypothetical protein
MRLICNFLRFGYEFIVVRLDGLYLGMAMTDYRF